MSGSDNSQDTWQKIFQPLVVILLTGLLAFQLPLQSKRPPTDPGPTPPSGIQLDARLWMDPFDAPVRDPNHEHATNPDDLGGQILRHMTESTVDKGPIFLGVMVDGGPYFESLERRRRVRYAVISGLMDLGYAPEDRDHIRYLHLKNTFNYLDPREDRVYSWAERRMPENMPYEWFAASPSMGKPAVMVLWLEEDALAERPLDKLRVIKNLLRLEAMRAIKTIDRKVALQIVLKSLLDDKDCLEGSQTQDKSNLNQFQTNWCAAMEIEDELPKEPPSQVELAKNAVLGLNEIKRSLEKKESCKENSEGKQPNEQPRQSDSANITVQAPNDVSQQDSCEENKKPEFDVKQDSFILRYLGPVRAETELLDPLQCGLKESVPPSIKRALPLLAADKFTLEVIGPNTSDALLAMAINAIQLTNEKGKEKSKPLETDSTNQHNTKTVSSLSQIRIISPVATVSSNFLASHLSSPLANNKNEDSDLSDLFAKVHFALQRTNQKSTDDRLVDALMGELNKRGVSNSKYIGDKIAIIAERDTLYSRGLVEAFRKAYSKPNNMPSYGYKISEYGYFRGLDGENAKKAENKAQGSGNASNSSQPSAKNYDDLMQNIRPRSFDYAYGDDQIDYLRRIADAIESQEQETGQPIRAIGLMGSDVYDKLLILQALKPRFPSAIFFTTELDARYFDRSAEGGSTGIARNLVVVSGQDLTPGSNTDKSVKSTITTNQQNEPSNGNDYEKARFRSSLQTEYYHAVFFALNTEKNNEPPDLYPKIFEIGSKKAHNLTSLIHSGPNLEFSNTKGYLMAILIILGVIVFSGYITCPTFKSKFNNLKGLVLKAGVGTLLSLIIVIYFSEEPFVSPLDGISMWWTEIIRVAAFWLGIGFIARIISEPKSSEYLYLKLMGLIVLPLVIGQGFRWCYDVPGWYIYIPSFISFFPYPVLAYIFFSKNMHCLFSSWRKYFKVSKIYYNDLFISFRSVAIYAFSIMAISSAFMFLSPIVIVPYRSDWARWADHIILDVSVACFITLLATILAIGVQIIERIKEIQKAQPMSTESIKKIGEITQAYYRIVWYPFIVAALLLIARSRIFDNWPMPKGLVMIFTMSFGLLIVCVFRIRTLALETKTSFEATLKKQPKDEKEKALEELKECKEGAYGSFLAAHPSLAGVTLLVGGGVLPDFIHWLLG